MELHQGLEKCILENHGALEQTCMQGVPKLGSSETGGMYLVLHAVRPTIGRQDFATWLLARRNASFRRFAIKSLEGCASVSVCATGQTSTPLSTRSLNRRVSADFSASDNERQLQGSNVEELGKRVRVQCSSWTS
jgi:hypothetical protein